MNDTLNYIPKKQFLKEMGISRYTFSLWIKEKGLPIIRIGYKTFVPFSEYKEWEKKYHKNIPQNSEQNKEFEWKNIFWLLSFIVPSDHQKLDRLISLPSPSIGILILSNLLDGWGILM